MTTVNKKELFQSGPEAVWAVATDLSRWDWRSDLARIEVLEEGKKFVEYTEDGYATTFVITRFEPYERYEFEMENENMRGRWTGMFRRAGQGTEADFTEDVTAKKAVMKPFVGLYLKKQQKRYMEDLKAALGEKTD